MRPHHSIDISWDESVQFVLKMFAGYLFYRIRSDMLNSVDPRLRPLLWAKCLPFLRSVHFDGLNR